VAKAFNTVGAEHLGNGRTDHGAVFLPVAGDPEAVAAVVALAAGLGFDVVDLGGREQFGMVEDHARLWIHLAFRCGWGRQFAFTVARS
jgi:predicted dinucleotide-binding enzyme